MNRTSAILLAAAALALTLAVALRALPHDPSWPAPEEAKKLKNPAIPTPEGLAAAKEIYLDGCAQCHGGNGKGDGPEAPMYDVQPSDLTDAHMMSEMTDGEIFWKISEGRKPMPSFKKKLTDEQRWQLVNYIRTFALKPKAAPRKKSPARR